ncbi:Uncharacterised protein [Chlamydia trachomatis]|nr:Uncharacterised protein [Chlamydia trachomatis]
MICSGLFCNHHNSRIILVCSSVCFLNKVNSLKVFAPTIHVWTPLASFTAVIQVEHRRHSVYTQSINVIFAKPEAGVSNQEVTNLVSAKVKYVRSPIWVLSAEWIWVFVKRGAVESTQSKVILREVCWNPIHNHTNASLVELVY